MLYLLDKKIKKLLKALIKKKNDKNAPLRESKKPISIKIRKR